MIVFPSGFTLSAGLGGVSLKNPRIGYDTCTRGASASQVTVSSERSDAPKDAPLRSSTYEYWQPLELPASWEIIFSDFCSVDYIGIVGNLGSVRASLLAETTDGTLAGSPSEYVWTQFAQDIIPADDAPIMMLDDARSVRGVRLTVDGDGEAPKIAVVYAGAVLAMVEPIRGGGHAPMTLKRETTLQQSLSRGGQFLDQSYRRLGEVGSASFEHLDAAWYRTYFDPFVKAARKYPFFFAWRPEQYTDEVSYAWADGDIRPQYEGSMDWMGVSFGMRGIGHE